MFGYLRPYIPELKVKDHHLYRSAYCGLCRSTKLSIGELPRLAIQYDIAVLALLLCDMAGLPYEMENRRCCVNPLQSKPVMMRNEILDYCADMGFLLAYEKFDDNWHDERHLPSAAARQTLALFRKDVIKRRPQMTELLQKGLAQLHQLERENCKQMDLPADAFGQTLADICLAAPGIPQDQALSWLCKQIGRWLYLIDALSDWEQDQKSGSYNPIQNKEQLNLAAESCRWAAGQMAGAVDLLSLTYSRAILENIIYQGLPAQLERAGQKESETVHE